MRISTRWFVVSFTVTTLLFALFAGIAAVSYKGEIMLGDEHQLLNLSYDNISAAYETADNAFLFFAPEARAAANITVMFCAALGKLLLLF